MSKNLWVIFFGALFFLVSASCKKVQSMKDDLDELSFAWTGGTIFGEPFQVTTKQLHFDTGELFGKDVMLEGVIQDRGDSGTYLVMADQEGRILVKLTSVDESYRLLNNPSIDHVKILGRLERGKKGLPYVLAKALKPGVKSPQ